MAFDLEAARAAGYSDAEINAFLGDGWAKARQAGYSDDEIRGFLGVEPPAEPAVPPAFLDRMREGTKVGRALTVAGDAARHAFGTEPIGFSEKSEQQLRALGIFRDPDSGRGGPIRLLNEALLRPAAAAVDLTLRGSTALATGTAAYLGTRIGQETGEMTGNEAGGETAGAQATRDILGLIQTLGVVSSTGTPFTRPKQLPDGRVVDQAIGHLPQAADFTDTAAVAVRNPVGTGPVARKLERTWNERGIHPAEVLDDAATDVTISQDLAAENVTRIGAYEPKPGAVAKPAAAGEQPALPAPPATSEPVVAPEPANALQRAGNIVSRETSEAGGLQTGASGGSGGGVAPPRGPGPGTFGDEPLRLPGPDRSPDVRAAEEHVLSRLSIGAEAPKRPYTWDRFYTDMVDDLHPVKVAAGQQPYELFRLTRGAMAKGTYAIDRAMFDFNTLQDIGPGLKQIIEPVRNDLDSFRAYIASKRALELSQRRAATRTRLDVTDVDSPYGPAIEVSERTEPTGAKAIRTGIDTDKAQAVVDAGSARFQPVLDQLVTYQNQLAAQLRDAGLVSRAGYDAMLVANRDYVPFFRVMDPEVSVGRGAASGLSARNPLKKIEGSERLIVDPIESIVKNTYLYVQLADKNAAGLALVDAMTGAKRQPLAGWGIKRVELPQIEVMTPEVRGLSETYPVKPELARELDAIVRSRTGEDGGTITVFRNGKPETWDVGPELAIAWRGADKEAIGWIIKAMAPFARSLRAGTTILPEFAAKNAIRDFQAAFINSKGLFSPVDTMRGLMGVIGKDADWANWVKSGGASATFNSLDRQFLGQSLSELAALDQQTGLGTRAWNVVTTPFHWARMFGDVMENSTRLGEFKKIAREAEGALPADQTSGLPKEQLQGAAYASREATLDFWRIGAKARAMNMISAFYNPSVQGLDRIVREARARPVNFGFKVTAGVTVPSVLLYLAQHDDPRYQEIPRWQKDLFWIVLTDRWDDIGAASGLPDGVEVGHNTRVRDGRLQQNNGVIWRIPKDHTIGVLFGSVPERLLDAWKGDNPAAFKDLEKTLLQVTVPPLVPSLLAPILEQWSNRTLFTDRNLVPQRLEKGLPEYQYVPYTTELAKKLGSMFGAFPGLTERAVSDQDTALGGVARALSSPILIENYVRQWTGGAGMYALQGADFALRKSGYLPDPEKPEQRWSESPFVRAFTVRYPTAQATSIDDFHDAFEARSRIYSSLVERAKLGDVPGIERVLEFGGPAIVRMDRLNRTLNDHQRLIQLITINPEIPGREKRQLIDTMYFNMIDLARQGNQIMRDTDKIFAPHATPQP